MDSFNKKKLAYAILSISALTVMAGAAMAPALGVIGKHFSGENPLLVQLIISMPALTIIITNLFFSSLCKIAGTRTIAVTGLVSYILFGAGAFFFDNIWIILALRALLGISVGMIMPLSTGLLSYYFPPEEQGKLMGLSAFMNQMGGVVATLLSGLLANISWNCSFLVYLLGIFVLILVLAVLPDERLATGEAAESCAPDYYESESGLTKARKNSTDERVSLLRFMPSVAGMYLQMLLFFIYPANFALITGRGSTMSGNEITLIMVGLDLIAAVIGIMFGRMMKLLPAKMKYVAPLSFMAGYALLGTGASAALILSGSFFVGIGNGAGMPYLNTIASIKGGKDAATTVMPLISAALYLGQFTSPLIITPLSRLVDSPFSPYLIGVLFGLLYLIQAYASRKYQALKAL